MDFNQLKAYQKPLFYGVMLFAGLFLMSLIASLLLGVRAVPTPYDIFQIMGAGFVKESVFSLSIVLLLALLISGYQHGGLKRVGSYYTLSVLGFLITGIFFGILVFQYWTGLHLNQPDILFQVMLGDELTRVEFRQLMISLLVGFLIPSFVVAPALFSRFSKEAKALGDAHFASGIEVQKAGFFDKEDGAILIGKKYGVPLWSNGFEHVLMFAATGSGKTRSISIPNLFQYPYSVVCNDIKLSLYEATSGYREKVLGHRCFCWSPTSTKTHRFNPLTYISDEKTKRMTDIQRIAHILIPDNKKDPIWSRASRKLFKAIILYLLDTPGATVTLGEINRVVKQANFDGWLQDILENTEHYDPDFYRNGFSYINIHEKTRGCILEDFSGYFELFDDPTIDNATSHTDFDIRNLRREKMTIYIGFTDDDMERLSPLLTLFWQQLISSMIQQLPDKKKEPYSVLCLIDEFSSLGRIERLRRSLKLLREYRVRCVLMLQYLGQTHEPYSHDEARAFTNIKTKIAYSTDDINDAEFISKLLGVCTKKVSSGSVSYQTRGMSDSKSYSYQAIPLMRPDKVVKLSSDVSLIMRTGHAPVKARQYIWFKESDMKHLKRESIAVPEHQIALHAFDHANKKKKPEKEKAHDLSETDSEIFV